MESYKKSYAEAVIGSNVLLSQSCWSHIQTQDEEDALVLALQDSLSMQVGKVWFAMIIYELSQIITLFVQMFYLHVKPF